MSITTRRVVAPRHVGVDPTWREPPSIFRAPCTQVAILAGGRRIDLTLRLAEQAAEQAALEEVAEIRGLRIGITAAERTAHRIAPLAGVRIAKGLLITEAIGGDLAWRHQGILGLLDLPMPHAEIFREAFGARTAIIERGAGIESDLHHHQLFSCLWRRLIERRLEGVARPGGFDDLSENRHGDPPAGLAATERAALAFSVVVADPDGDRHVVGKADEPGIVPITPPPPFPPHVR